MGMTILRLTAHILLTASLSVLAIGAGAVTLDHFAPDPATFDHYGNHVVLGSAIIGAMLGGLLGEKVVWK